MSAPYLLVPVALEALVVNQADLFATSFSVAGKQYSGMPDLERIEPPPFISGNDRPRKGVTLHWALPDGLTRGRLAHAPGDQLIFPAVPNRWLILRLVTQRVIGANGTEVRTSHEAWVVESDHLSANGTNPYPDPTAASVGQLTGLGRSMKLSTWLNGGALLSNGNLRLTALGLADRNGILVGAADPSFAAYVANVDDVFSFYDDLSGSGIDSEKAASLSYMAMGWFDRDENDPLNNQSQYRVLDGKTWALSEEWLKVMEFWGWSVGDAAALDRAVLAGAPGPNATAREKYPSRTLCHGMVYDVNWTGLSGGVAQPYLQQPRSAFNGMALQSRIKTGKESMAEAARNQLPQIAIGNSSTDALASMLEYLLHRDDNGLSFATLFQSLEYGLATSYDEPGGVSELAERIHQAGFTSFDGGSYWEVTPQSPEPQPQAADGNPAQPEPPALTAEQKTAIDNALAALNNAQRDFDIKQQQAASLGGDLYRRKWRAQRIGKLPGVPFAGAPASLEAAKAFYHIADVQAAADGAAAEAGNLAGSLATRRAALDQALEGTAFTVKENKLPRFWRPSDPVVVVYGCGRSSKHGGDGRYTADDSLFCRFSGQEIASYKFVPNTPGGAAIAAPTIAAGEVLSRFLSEIFPSPLPSGPAERALPQPAPGLAAELVFLNPSFASLLYAAITSSTQTMQIAADQQLPWADENPNLTAADLTAAAGFTGVRPSKVGVEAWAQPWAPLFLDWRVTWFPSDPDSLKGFTDEWLFNGRDYDWTGFELIDDRLALTLQGRSILSAIASQSLSDNLKAHLDEAEADLQLRTDRQAAALLKARAANDGVAAASAQTEIDKLQTEMADLKATRLQLLQELASADLLAQTLTGFHDSLIMRDPTASFDPKGPSETRQGGARLAPKPFHSGARDGHFYPIRAGHFRLEKLWVVDGFGQVFDPITERNQTPLSYAPLRGSGTVTVGLTQRQDTSILQMPPRLSQPARLQFRFVDPSLANGVDAPDATFAGDANPICGWLLPNHLDHSLTVFDNSGKSLGALLRGDEGANPLIWQPTIGSEAAVATPEQIPNPHQRAMILALRDHATGEAAFTDLMTAIDSTLWTIEPLGKRSDNLSTLIGRPIALVRARLELELGEDPATRQLWEDGGNPGNTRGFEAAEFTIDLGDVELRDDGTLGFFSPAGGLGTTIDYSVFQAVHGALDVTRDGYVIDSDSVLNDEARRVKLKLKTSTQSMPTHVTLLMDPRGSVHARTGILPGKALRLPRRHVAAALETMNVTFRVGPILHERGDASAGLRMPLPVNVAGSWSWIEQTGVALIPAPEQIVTIDKIVQANQQARLADAPLHAREGYLKLSDALGRDNS